MSNHLIEFLNNNTNNNYPFVSEVPSGLRSLIADIYILSKTKDIDTFYVESMASDGTDLTVEISDGLTSLFNDTITTSTSYGEYRTYVGTSSSLEVRVLVKISELDVFNYTGPFTLINRVVDFVSNKVFSINNLTGNITIKPGYNMQFETTKINSGFGTEGSIKLNAVAGEGLGYFDENVDCSSVSLKSFNGLSPDDVGNISLNGDGCVWGQLSTNSISFQENCESCLDCTRIDDLNAFLTDTRSSGSSVRLRLKNALAVYEDYVSLLSQFKAEMDEIKFVGKETEIARDKWSLDFKIQTGKYHITNVNIGYTYVSTDVNNPTTVSIIPYSAYKKLPGQLLVLDSSFAGSVVASDLDPYKYARWFWSIEVLPEFTDLPCAVDLTWTASADWEERDDDGNVLSSGSENWSQTINITVDAVV